MPYRKQRETNARKVNKIKILKKEGGGGGKWKRKKKKRERNKIIRKAAAVSARDLELSDIVKYRAFFFFDSAIISH